MAWSPTIAAALATGEAINEVNSSSISLSPGNPMYFWENSSHEAAAAAADLDLTNRSIADGMSSLGPARPSSSSIQAWVTLRYVALFLFLLTFFFGIIGNSLTILVILLHKRMKTVATCFMLNLAVADDLFMLSLPFMAYSTFTGSWIFGSFLCKIMSALYGVNLYASIFTMVLMSFDRYLAIVHPLRSIRYRTVKNAGFVCGAIWLACCIIMMPYWLYARTGYGGRGSSSRRCQIYWPSNSLGQHTWFWTNFQLIIGFALPIVIMVVCYLKLLRTLVVNAMPVHQDPSRRPIRKVTLMVFIVTLVFVLCWTPYHILRYNNAHRSAMYRAGAARPTEAEMLGYAVFSTVSQALVFLSSCCNPIIYGISSRNFHMTRSTAAGDRPTDTAIGLEQTANVDRLQVVPNNDHQPVETSSF